MDTRSPLVLPHLQPFRLPLLQPLLLPLLLGALALTACARTSAAPDSSAPPQREDVEDPAARALVVELNRALMDRYNTGDMLGVAALYADDAVMLGPDGYRVEGRAAIDAYWARIEQPLDWRLEVVRVEGERGLLHQRGVSHLRYRRDGQEHLSTVQFVVIWARQADGEYRVAVDAYW